MYAGQFIFARLEIGMQSGPTSARNLDPPLI